MPIFVRYQYQIAGEADIKRSMTSVAAHAERENNRVLKAQARARAPGGALGSAANSNASIKEAEREAIARMKASENAEKKAAATALKEHTKAEREKTKATERAAKERAKIESEWARKQAQLKDQHIRDVARRERDEERATMRSRHAMYNTTRGVIGGTARTVSNVGKGALAVTGIGGVALAANALHEGMAVERSAAGLANQMAKEGETPEQIKKRIASITKRAHEVKGFSSGDVIGSARAFGGISGDYQLGLDMTDQLAQIALATDVNLEEVSKVAGNAYMKLKTPGMSSEEAQSQTLEAVRTFAGQGNIGAVEIKDLAQYGGRLTAGAAKFKGTRLENMKQMGAMAQVAVGAGSATDAAEATEAAVRFASDLTQHADKVGQLSVNGKRISAFTDPGAGPGKNTQLRGIKDIVADVVQGTGGSATMMKDIFGERSAKITEAFSRMYTEAETANAALPAEQRKKKGEAGRAAIVAEFDKFDKAALKEKDQLLRAEAALSTTTAQLDEAMKSINAALASELLPVMPPLIHSFAQLAKPLADIVGKAAMVASWLASNPFVGLSALISAALLKELIAAKIGDIIKRSITGEKGGFGGIGAPVTLTNAGGKATSVAGALGAAGTGLAIGAMVYSAIDMAGKSQYDEGVKKTGDISRGLANVQGPELEAGIADAKKRLEEYQKDKGFIGGLFSSTMNVFGAGDAAEVKGIEDLIARKQAELESWKNSDEGKAASAEQQKLITEQTKAATMMQDAAKAIAANAGGSQSGTAPNRGNEPSKPVVK